MENIKTNRKPNDKNSIKISERSSKFLQTYFPNSTEHEWNNWQWQIKNSFTSVSQLQTFLNLYDNEKINQSNKDLDNLPIRITPYYASLIDANNNSQSIRKTVVPTIDEYILNDGELSDPLCENNHSPVSNIVHRYPDRVLFLVTGFCSSYCRYCTRSHLVAKNKCHFGIADLESAFQYIETHTEIRDVLLSGGDPLTLKDDTLFYILTRLKKIPHVEFIRIGTKVPIVLPQRITTKLVNMLKKFHPLFISIHVTHPDELTQEVTEACNRLSNAGIPLGSQTVLLKGINDNINIIKPLMHKLLTFRIRPYYIYSMDKIQGGKHFQSTIETGLQIINDLRGHTTGYAVPQFIVDSPDGKIAVQPNSIKSVESFNDKKVYTLQNYNGNQTIYDDYK